MTRRSAWSAFADDPFADGDPAVRRLRDALELRPPAETPEPVPAPAPAVDPVSELAIARQAAAQGIPGALERLRAAIAKVRGRDA